MNEVCLDSSLMNIFQTVQTQFRGRQAGLGIALLVALPALWLGGRPGLAALGLSALTLAVLGGMVVGALPAVAGRQGLDEGLTWAKGPLLRLAVMGYGLRVTGDSLRAVGTSGLALDLMIVTGTLLLAAWFGITVLKLDRRTALLVGAGSAICGAAAVLATESVVKGGPARTAVAVATVVLFGSVSMLAYPWLFTWAHAAGWVEARQFALYTGATVHEVAQVVAAGQALGPADQLAVTTKMVRVALLAPALLVLTSFERGGGRITIPWFAFGFLALAGIRTLDWLPAAWLGMANLIDTGLLAVAMAAVGLTTRWSTVGQAGWKPMLLAAVLFGWLVVGGAGLAMLIVG